MHAGREAQVIKRGLYNADALEPHFNNPYSGKGKQCSAKYMVFMQKGKVAYVICTDDLIAQAAAEAGDANGTTKAKNRAAWNSRVFQLGVDAFLDQCTCLLYTSDAADE